LLAAIRIRCPAARISSKDSNSEILAFAHEDHPGKLGIAAQTLVTLAHGPVQQELLEDALGQTWSFPEM
jgi:hypothetical protein